MRFKRITRIKQLKPGDKVISRVAHALYSSYPEEGLNNNRIYTIISIDDAKFIRSTNDEGITISHERFRLGRLYKIIPYKNTPNEDF